MRFLLAAQFVAFPLAASAQAAVAADGRGTDWIAIGMFVAIVLTTLVITYRSAGRTKSRVDFYTAGHAITPLQNGLAIAGDFLSAAAFLGISALVYSNGFDGFLYALGFLTGWPIVLFLMSERLRNLGSYTFADAAAFRLDRTPIRLVAAIGSLVVVLFYLVAQMIGAGKVIELLFGVNYLIAVTSVGVLMILYVTVGGRRRRGFRSPRQHCCCAAERYWLSPCSGTSISALQSCLLRPAAFIPRERRSSRRVDSSPSRSPPFRSALRSYSERPAFRTS